MHRNHRSAVSFTGAVALASLCLSSALAQTPGAPGTLADNHGILIDGTTFKIVPGQAKDGAAKYIAELGARPLGGSALVFRSAARLYIVETPELPMNSALEQKSGAADADEERPDRVRIEYVEPKNPEHRKLYEMVKERRALEILQQIFSPFRLPVEVTVKTIGCDGVANAWYERRERQPLISLCYEYLQEIMQRVPKETTTLGLSPADVVVGQFLYAALHELGHAVFDVYDVPVFGREEDAADLFAAYVMLQFRNGQARQLLGGAAYSYLDFVAGFKDKPKVTVPLLAFASNHGSPEERFYNLLCIAYGSDQKMFSDLVEKEYLPKSRAAGCKYEFQVLRYAFRNQIMPHVDRQKADGILDMTWLAQPNVRPATP